MNSKVEQYVMAYQVEAEELEQLLPQGYRSLRPVLRINVELLSDVKALAGKGYKRVEFNTPVEYKGRKGWLNLKTWIDEWEAVSLEHGTYGITADHADISVKKEGSKATFQASANGFSFLEIAFTRVGKEGGCPKEADNEGTLYYFPAPQALEIADRTVFLEVETVDQKKEYCDCDFQWRVPAFEQMPMEYAFLQKSCSVEKEEILGAYVVSFERPSAARKAEIL